MPPAYEVFIFNGFIQIKINCQYVVIFLVCYFHFLFLFFFQYDEVVPEDQAPELDGFYINKGQLILKRVDGRSSSDHSDSDSSEGPQNPKSLKVC